MTALPGHAFRRANPAGDQHGPARQQLGDLGERIGLPGEKEREGQFRPDQMGHIAHADRLRPAGAIRQREIARHHLLLLRVVEFLILLEVRLHDAKPHVRDVACRRARQPHRAVGRHCRKQRDAQCRRQPWPPGIGTVVGEHRRRRVDADRQEGRAPKAEAVRRSAPARAARSARSHRHSTETRSTGGRAAIRRQSAPAPAPEGAWRHGSRSAGPAPAQAPYRSPARPAVRSPRTAAASRRPWLPPGRHCRPSKGRQGNSRSRTTSPRSRPP